MKMRSPTRLPESLSRLFSLSTFALLAGAASTATAGIYTLPDIVRPISATSVTTNLDFVPTAGSTEWVGSPALPNIVDNETSLYLKFTVTWNTPPTNNVGSFYGRFYVNDAGGAGRWGGGGFTTASANAFCVATGNNSYTATDPDGAGPATAAPTVTAIDRIATTTVTFVMKADQVKADTSPGGDWWFADTAQQSAACAFLWINPDLGATEASQPTNHAFWRSGNGAGYQGVTFNTTNNPVQVTFSNITLYTGTDTPFASVSDTTPPSPNPMTWASPPAATSESAITMTANTATDPNGPVEYLFTETSGNPGATSSAWQASPTYTDTGLSAATTYTYTVQARDALGNTNTATAPAGATTNAADVTAPDTPTLVEPLSPVTYTSISMTANAVTDPSGPVQYRFIETSGNPGGTTSGWQTSTTYIDSGLQSGTTYSYTVQARDSSPGLNESLAADPVVSATTLTDSQAPPTPAFASVVASYNSVSLTAVAVVDPENNGVEYRFHRYHGGGSPEASSDWQTGTTWIDTGVSPSTSYTYTVQARDAAPTPNVSAESAPQPANTPAAPTGTLTDNLPIQCTSSTNSKVLISVTPGSEGFSSDSATIDESFNASVLSYAFFSAATPYATGGGKVSNLTNVGAADTKTDLWATSSTAGAADFSSQGVKSKAETGTNNGTMFTVNISGMTSGSVYVFNGSWQARTDWLTVAMTGTGTTVSTDSGNGDGDGNSATFGFSPAVTGAFIYAKRIDFSNTSLDYSTITVVVHESGNQDGYFSGVVLTGTGGGGSAYSDWASSNAPTTGNDPTADEDGDGVSNALEYVLGGAISTNDLDKLPELAEDGTNMALTFLRDRTSKDGSAVPTIEVSTDLNDWSTSYSVPDMAEANNPGVTVIENTPSGFDTVTLTVPMSPDTKKFARLKVLVTP